MSARGLLVSGEGKGRGANVIKEAEKILGGEGGRGSYYTSSLWRTTQSPSRVSNFSYRW